MNTAHTVSEKLEEIRFLIEEKGTRIFSLLNDLPIAICITDQDGIFKLINDQYCKTYGYEAKEILGKHFTVVVPEGKKELLKNLHDDFIQNKYELQGEWEVQDRNGLLIKIVASAAYIEDESGNPFKATFLVRQMKYEDWDARLEKTIEYLSDDSQVFADRQLLFHDLKDNLAKNFSISDLLGMSEIEPVRCKRIDMIRREEHQAIQVMEILSGLIQMEKKKFVLHKKPLDLIKMIRKIILENSHIYQEENISFSMKIADQYAYDLEKVIIEGDEIYLELMFQNLFFYMLSASSDHSEVTVMIERNAHIHIRIESTSNKSASTVKQTSGDRIKHLSYLVVREHGGDITFSGISGGKQSVSIILPA